MSDRSRIAMTNLTASQASSLHGGKRSSVARGAPKGYGQAEEVSRRANVLNGQDTPQNLASLKRLNRVLSSHQPLRGDVPRGYYLNIRV